MLKKMILGEKLMRATTGGKVCCWGGPDDGCDCSATHGQNFTSISDVWLTRMGDLSGIFNPQ